MLCLLRSIHCTFSTWYAAEILQSKNLSSKPLLIIWKLAISEVFLKQIVSISSFSFNAFHISWLSRHIFSFKREGAAMGVGVILSLHTALAEMSSSETQTQIYCHHFCIPWGTNQVFHVLSNFKERRWSIKWIRTENKNVIETFGGNFLLGKINLIIYS